MDAIEFEIRCRGLLSMKLLPATTPDGAPKGYNEVYPYIQYIPGLTQEQYHELCNIIFARQGRGTATLEDAKDMFCMPTDYRSGGGTDGHV